MIKTTEIPISKDIYSFKDIKNSINRDFIEFLPKNVSINEIFDIYNSLFYEIETFGKKSHSFIVKESSEYAGVPVDPQIEEIDNLKEQIITLKEDIDSIEDEHPFIPNRSIIQNRTNNELNYYMQSGRKRQINDDRAFLLIKKQSGLNKNSTNLEYSILLDQLAIGGIVSGPPINDLNDLNIDILEINRYGQSLIGDLREDNTNDVRA